MLNSAVREPLRTHGNPRGSGCFEDRDEALPLSHIRNGPFPDSCSRANRSGPATCHSAANGASAGADRGGTVAGWASRHVRRSIRSD